MALFFVLALTIGGGGSPAPLSELILELLAVLTATLILVGVPGSPDLRRVPRTAWIIAAVIIALPLVQLIPLPPFIWHALPGRELQRDALALVGQQASWRSWTLAPHRTFASLLSLGPPLLMLIMTSAVGVRGRTVLVGSLIVAASATLLLGAVQLTTGESDAVLTGFQANRNSTADLLLAAIVAVPLMVQLVAARRRHSTNPLVVLGIAGAGMLVFAAAVVLTGSRAGMILLPIALLAGLWLLRGRIKLTTRTLMLALGGLLIAIIGSYFAALSNPTLTRIFSRFSLFSEEFRPQLWRDGMFVVQQHFPFGVGMGNFVPALVADERLEVIVPLLPNRAHNDFIELAAEAGAFGMLALSAISLLLSRAALRTRRLVQVESSGLLFFAATTLGLFALHSLVDYPFRSMSLASLGAVCGGLLCTPRSVGTKANRGSDTV